MRWGRGSRGQRRSLGFRRGGNSLDERHRSVTSRASVSSGCEAQVGKRIVTGRSKARDARLQFGRCAEGPLRASDGLC